MREQKFESYFGRRIAIDASMSIYQFLVCPPFLTHMSPDLLHFDLLPVAMIWARFLLNGSISKRCGSMLLCPLVDLT